MTYLSGFGIGVIVSCRIPKLLTFSPHTVLAQIRVQMEKEREHKIDLGQMLSAGLVSDIVVGPPEICSSV